MRIGLDAKRAFHNSTGLGNYSRTLIRSLDRYFPENDYFLFNPKPSKKYSIEGEHLHPCLPNDTLHKLLPAFWRSRWILNDLRLMNIDLYHGLSHEIPFGIGNTSIKSIVTVHDLIFLKYPNQYNPIDVKTYDYKMRYACQTANHVIASSNQTKNDLIELYGIPEQKITVCYQSCDERFTHTIDESIMEACLASLPLPARFFLYVGSIIERKGLLSIVEALQMIPPVNRIPLVVIGNGRQTKKQVMEYIEKHGMTNDVLFLNDWAAGHPERFSLIEQYLPAIYHAAYALIYPSQYEGFGIPVLEALSCGVPVITSDQSCLPEVGGPGSIYVNPTNKTAIQEAMTLLSNSENKRSDMRSLGLVHAKQFSEKACVHAVMEVYKKVMQAS
ncbi:MAG: glycosyltransferase family 4 protein [Ferruginibacter sp.]